MGEIAEMMLDGTLCEGCGEFIGNNVGYPQYCSDQCAADRGLSLKPHKPLQEKKRHKCTACNKKFQRLGSLKQHWLVKHEGAP